MEFGFENVVNSTEILKMCNIYMVFTWPFQDFPGPTRKATERSGEAGRRAQDREKAGDLMILMMCRLQNI